MQAGRRAHPPGGLAIMALLIRGARRRARRIMAELEARFETDPSQGWQRPLAVGESFVLGRHPGDGGWPTEWDNFISRRHASMTWDGAKLLVVRQPSAGNPIFFKGAPADDFAVYGGETFRIGN